MKQSSGARPVRSLFGGHRLGQGGRPVASRSTECTACGVLHHGLGLLALELADEVPAQAEVAELRRLLRGFLVPVLPDVRDAERGEPPDVLGRVEFGDHDQPRRPILPAGGGDGAVDPLAGRRRAAPGAVPAGDRAARRRAACSVIRSFTGCPVQSRRCRSVHTSPANRPVCRVAAVGEQGVRLPGCSRRSIRPLTPASCSWLRTAAGRSRPGVPREVVHQAAGTRAATSSRMSSGTS